jgi:hypothetical protein
MTKIFKLLRRFFYWIGLHFHFQNLNEKPRAKGQKPRYGSMLIEGRWWLDNSGEDENGQYRDKTWEVHFSWALFKHHCGFSFTCGGGDMSESFSFAIHIPWLLSVWLEVENKFTQWFCLKFLPTKETDCGKKYVEAYGSRQFYFSIYRWLVTWKIWANGDSWEDTRSRFRDGSFSIDRFFLGEREYEKIVLEEGELPIPMPEKTYIGKYKLTERSRWRSRFPFKKISYHGEFETKEGIPTPGKGTTSWNCGPDATYSLSCPAKTKWQLIGAVLESVMRDRYRYANDPYYCEREVNVC